jgi:flagellum-specific peptidoglycan hydrolase FlgJ
MFKKILFLILIVLVASCKGTKYTTANKNTKPKPKTTATTPVKKPTQTKPVVNTNKSGSTEIKQSETLQSTSTTVVYAEVVKAYIEQFKEVAKDNMRQHGIPASITLAQGILESGAGNGRLAKEANNHFGIKCHTNWTGETITHDDDALQECFRKYRHASESFKDHSQFLTSRTRYNSLFKLTKDDYKGWAKGLRQAGYATDPNYPDKLIGIIERYELYKYDDEVLGNKTRIIEKPSEQQAQTQIASSTNTTSSGNTHKVSQGDTLYNISKRYSMTVDELKSLNNLADNTLSIGQILRVK